MKTGREFFDRTHGFKWKSIFSTKRHSEGTELPQMQVKESQSLPQREPLPSIEKKCGIGLATEERLHAFRYTSGQNSCVSVATVPRGSLLLMNPDCRSSETTPNKPKLVQVKEQTEARPLQELLHLKEEPFRLWELLQMKEETVSSLMGKNSEVLKEPLYLLHKKNEKLVISAEEEKHTLILNSSSNVLSGSQTKIFQSAQPTLHPVMSTGCNLSALSLPKNTNTPSMPMSNPRSSGSKKPLMFLESLYKALLPSKLAYRYYCVPLLQPFSERALCIRDTDHDIMVTREKSIGANPMIRGSKTSKPHMHGQSSEQNCNGREEVPKHFESMSSFKKRTHNVVGNEVGKVSLRSDDEGLDRNVLQLDQCVKESPQKLQNQHTDAQVGPRCQGILRRTGSLKERTSSASATKSFLLRSYSLKEGITSSKFFCFSREPVQDCLSGKETDKRTQKVVSLSETSEGNHASILREDHLPRKNKVYPSDGTEESFLVNHPDKSIRISMEQNSLANFNSKDDVACRTPILDLKTQPDCPSNISCSLSGVNRVTTLRDMLCTNTEIEDLPVIGRENSFETCDKVYYLDMINLEATQTHNPQSSASDLADECQVHMLDHDDLGYEEAPSPNVQKKVFFPEIFSCDAVEGSESISNCKLVGDNGQPSPVSVLDSPFIDEFVSPEKDRIFSDSEDQLIDEYCSSSQPFLEIAAVETSSDMLDDTSDSSYYEYAAFEKLVETLVHSSIIEDAKNLWSEDNKWHSKDAHVSVSSSNNTFSLQYQSPNCPLPEDEKGQGCTDDETLRPRCRNDYEYAFLNRQGVLEELSKNQMLLDCVTEALETLDIRERCDHAVTLGLHNRTYSRKMFINDLYQVIFSWSRQTAATMDDLVEKDLNFSNWRWISIKSELHEVGTEIECSLLEILIEAVVFEMLNMEAEF